MMNRTALLTAALVAALGISIVSCSSSGVSVKTCAELYAPGNTAPDTKKTFACKDANGANQVMAFATIDCGDGTQVSYNNLGWWRSTDHIVHAGQVEKTDCPG